MGRQYPADSDRVPLSSFTGDEKTFLRLFCVKKNVFIRFMVSVLVVYVRLLAVYSSQLAVGLATYSKLSATSSSVTQNCGR